MPPSKRGEAQKRVAGAITCTGPARAKATCIDNPRPPQQQTKKRNTAARRTSKSVSSASNGSTPPLTFHGSFPLLRLPTVKETYASAVLNTFGKNAVSTLAGSSRLPSGDHNSVAAIFLRHLRNSCATYPGRVSIDGSSSNVGSGGGGNSSNSDVLCSTAGLSFYRQLYDLYRWLFPCGTCENERPIVAKRAWQALFSRKNRPWRVLISFLESDLILSDKNAASGFLTMLYNILRTTSRTRRKRVVMMCCRLRLAQLCAAILEVYEDAFVSSVRIGDCSNSSKMRNVVVPQEKDSFSHGLDMRLLGFDSLPSPSFTLMRVVESIAMILGICGNEYPKMLHVVRRSKTLTSLLRITEVLFTRVTQLLSQIQVNEKTNIEADGEGNKDPNYFRNEDQSYYTAVCGRVLPPCDALLHLIVSLYQLTSLPASADVLGARGVKLCVHVGWVLHGFLSKRTHLTSHDPLWLLWDHLEKVVFWSIELLCRICCWKRSSKVSLEAAREHGAVDLLMGFSTHPAGRPEIVISSLNGLNVLTIKDTGCREQLHSDKGGLSTLVQGVITAAESAGRSAAHWHKLYLSLYALFGIVTLPGEVSVSQLNANAPPTIRRVAGENSFSLFTPNTPPNVSMVEVGGMTLPLSPLPIDFMPAALSPELHRDGDWGFCSDMFAFTAPNILPWCFSDQGLPLTREIAFSLFPDNEEFEVMKLRGCLFPNVPETLQPSSTDVHIRVLMRLIERLCTSLHYMNRIVYERPPLTLLKPPPPMMMMMPEDMEMLTTTRTQASTTSTATGVSCPSLHAKESPHFGVSSPPSSSGFLKFRSNFECGNLQRAVAISEDEYDLILCPDTNTNCHVQWFCFSVEDYTPGMTYRFNVLNMEKSASTFNEGQQPLMLFVEDSSQNTKPPVLPYWVRCGHDIYYYQNLYQRPVRCTTTTAATTTNTTTATCATNGVDEKDGLGTGMAKNPYESNDRVVNGKQQASKKTKKSSHSKRSKGRKTKETLFYYTLSFSVVFPEKKGRVFLANCFPYTYTNLLDDVQKWEEQAKTCLDSSASMTVQQLCYTPGGLPVPILTVTGGISNDDSNNVDTESILGNNTSEEPNFPAAKKIEERPVCIVTARVHPGESNASWMLRGLVNYLLRDDDEAQALRSSFVWKIIPMLNPDGVVLGNHRCSLGGADLNRDYAEPKPWVNPTIYSLKQLIQHIITREQRHVAIFADLHGHSRAKNFLIYGCSQRPEGHESKFLAKASSALPSPMVSSGSSILDCRRQVGVPASVPSLSTSSVSVEKLLPFLLGALSPAFSIPQCSFTVHKSKRNTGRVIMYRQLGIRMSYTLEATMMGGKCNEIFPQNAPVCTSRRATGTRCHLQHYQNEEKMREEEGNEDEMVAGEEWEGKQKKKLELSPREVSYTTRQYENMGRLLARGLYLLTGNTEGLSENDKEALEHAWSRLSSTTSNVDVPASSNPPLMGGSYAFSTRKERRSDGGKVKKEKRASSTTLSAEQRKELLRTLFVRSKLPGARANAMGIVYSGSDSDDEEESESVEDEDDDVENNSNARASESDNDNDDDDDDDVDEDEDPLFSEVDEADFQE